MEEKADDRTPRAVQACHELLAWLIPPLDRFPAPVGVRGSFFAIIVYNPCRDRCQPLAVITSLLSLEKPVVE